jgi:hypothetical protein
MDPAFLNRKGLVAPQDEIVSWDSMHVETANLVSTVMIVMVLPLDLLNHKVRNLDLSYHALR